MSWWNGLSTHRTASGNFSRDAMPRQPSDHLTAHDGQPASADRPAGAPMANGGSGAELISDKVMWGSLTRSDAASLWQTSGSGGLSDQLGLSATSPLWTTQPQRSSSQRSATDAYLSSPHANDKGLLADGVRPVTEGNSRHSGTESGGAVSTGECAAMTSHSAAGFHPNEHSGSFSLHAAEDHFHVSNDEMEDGNDATALFDGVDVGTISSLIASLQGRSMQQDPEDEDTLGTAKMVLDDGTLRGPATLTPLTLLLTNANGTMQAPGAAAAVSACSGSNAPLRRSQASTPTVFRDPSAGSGHNSRDSTVVYPHSDSAGATSPSSAPSERVAPHHLNRSTLEDLLANFQLALKTPATTTPPAPPATHAATADMEGPRMDRYRSSISTSSPSTGGELAGMRAIASEVDAGAGGGGVAVSEASAEARQARACSPVLRNRVNSIVAHKLNIDPISSSGINNGCRAAVHDFRGDGLVPASSADSNPSDSPTLMQQQQQVQGGRMLPPSNCGSSLMRPPQRDRAASPDSSIDRFFSSTTPSAISAGSTAFSTSRQCPRVSSCVGEDGNAMSPHRAVHLRTTSEASLPAAAATYHGGGALQQHVDEQGCVTVVDPQRRKLHVPLSAIQTTKALNGRLKTPSLCLLYQSGRCRQGDNCYQVHVDPATVDRLRADVESMPCCCLLHGDCNSHLADLSTYEGRSLYVAGQFNVPFTRVAYTTGLQRVLQEEPACVAVNPSVLCRLHGQPGGCRFGADCKFLHVCCTILRDELASVMSNAAAAAAVSATPATSVPPANAVVPASPTNAIMKVAQAPSRSGGPTATATAAATAVGGAAATSSNYLTMQQHLQSSAAMPLLPSHVDTPAARAGLEASPNGTRLPPPAELVTSPFVAAPSPHPMHSASSPLQGGLISGRCGVGGSAPTSGVLHNRNVLASTATSTSVAGGPGAANSLISTNFSPVQLSHGAPFVLQHSNSNTNLLPSSNFNNNNGNTSNGMSGGGGPFVSNANFAVMSGGSRGIAVPQQQPQQQPQIQQQQHPSGQFFAITPLQQPRGSSAQAPVSMQQPQPPLSGAAGAPQAAFHARALSTQSNSGASGVWGNPYSSLPVGQTPNHNGAGSPMTFGLPPTRGSPSMAPVGSPMSLTGSRSSGAFSSPMQRAPLPPSTREPTPPHTQEHRAASPSQQFYVQQINQDGTIFLVPLNVMQTLRSG